MIAAPPSSLGAVQVSATAPSPAWPETAVGAPGAVAPARGVTAALAAESAPVPTAFVAATVNVYAVPFVRPVTWAPAVAEPVSTGVRAVAPACGVMR